MYMPGVMRQIKDEREWGCNDIHRQLRILAGVLSKPVALDGFKFLSAEITLLTRIGENLNCACGIG